MSCRYIISYIIQYSAVQYNTIQYSAVQCMYAFLSNDYRISHESWMEVNYSIPGEAFEMEMEMKHGAWSIDTYL